MKNYTLGRKITILGGSLAEPFRPSVKAREYPPNGQILSRRFLKLPIKKRKALVNGKTSSSQVTREQAFNGSHLKGDLSGCQGGSSPCATPHRFIAFPNGEMTQRSFKFEI